VWKWEQQEPFGANAANDDPDSDAVAFEFNLRLPGQYLDRETGLNYNGFRDYATDIGRYVEADPLGLSAGPNLFAYVEGTPLTRMDRLGLQAGPSSASGVTLPSTTTGDIRIELKPSVTIPQPGPNRFGEPEIVCFQWWEVVQEECGSNCPPYVQGVGVGRYAGVAMLAAIRNAKAKLPRGCGLGTPRQSVRTNARGVTLTQSQCRPPIPFPPPGTPPGYAPPQLL